jgi:hypothetical protein
MLNWQNVKEETVANLLAILIVGLVVYLIRK